MCDVISVYIVWMWGSCPLQCVDDLLAVVGLSFSSGYVQSLKLSTGASNALDLNLLWQGRKVIWFGDLLVGPNPRGEDSLVWLSFILLSVESLSSLLQLSFVRG